MNGDSYRVKKGLILCAGKGSSLRPLTLDRSKPGVMLANRPIICYCIQKLLEINIREIGIVIGPKGDDLKEIVSSHFPDLCPVFITQQTPTGVAAAVSEAGQFVAGDPFVLLLGDNLLVESLNTLTERYVPDCTDAVIMVTYVENPEKFGVVVFAGDKVSKLIEKPKMFVSNWAITGAYVFGPAIFMAIDNIVPSWRGELEITDAIQWLVANGKSVVPVKTDKWWLDTGTPENLLKANRFILEKMSQKITFGMDCQITNCTLVPPLIIGDRCTFIDSAIGPYVSVGRNSKLTNVRTYDSIFMEDITLFNIKPIISNSIIGSRVKIDNLGINDNLKVLMGEYSFLHGYYQR